MIELTAIAEVWYACELTEENEQKVREFMESEGVDVDYAVRELWMRNEIEIYTNSIESDFRTQEIYDVVGCEEEEEEDEE